MTLQRITQRPRSLTHSDWPFCVEIGGRIKSESLAALDRNHWPLCVGMRKQGKGGNAAAAMTPACPKPTKNQSYAEPVQLSRPEYPSQSPTHHADTQISPITLKSSASKTPREKSGKNLPFVVDNPRFLILPWIEIPNLGSHILALIRRRLPDDWTERYNTTPVLIETFVETPRYTGAVYKASGWIHVGATKGRSRYDRDKLYDKPRKDIWLRPLRRDWKRTLNR